MFNLNMHTEMYCKRLLLIAAYRRAHQDLHVSFVLKTVVSVVSCNVKYLASFSFWVSYIIKFSNLSFVFFRELVNFLVFKHQKMDEM
jgi:hypothetical protein